MPLRHFPQFLSTGASIQYPRLVRNRQEMITLTDTQPCAKMPVSSRVLSCRHVGWIPIVQRSCGASTHCRQTHILRVRRRTTDLEQCVCRSVNDRSLRLRWGVFASMVQRPYLHHPTTIMLLTCPRTRHESPNSAVLSREGGNAAHLSPFWHGEVRTISTQGSRQSHLSTHALTVIRTQVDGAGEDPKNCSSRSMD